MAPKSGFAIHDFSMANLGSKMHMIFDGLREKDQGSELQSLPLAILNSYYGKLPFFVIGHLEFGRERRVAFLYNRSAPW